MNSTSAGILNGIGALAAAAAPFLGLVPGPWSLVIAGIFAINAAAHVLLPDAPGGLSNG